MFSLLKKTGKNTGKGANVKGKKTTQREKAPPVLGALDGLKECIDACQMEFDIIVGHCKRRGEKYEDPDFPVLADPERCLYINNPNAEIHAPAQWLRPTDLSSDPQMFVEGVHAGDIQQGVLGTCYLLGALAGLSAHKGHLESIFVAHDFEAGVVGVRFFDHNCWKYIIIDDLIGCNEDGRILYSHCKAENEFWLPLIEKAWAKLHGCYEQTSGGWEHHALMDLTGGAGQYVEMSELGRPESVHAFLSSALRKGMLVCASACGGRETDNGSGLYESHAYTVLQAVETSHGHLLVQLRNPWGRGEWRGDWSDASGMLTDEICKELKHVIDDEDGTFWMSAEDFQANFTMVDLCRTFNSEWRVASIDGVFEESDLDTPFYRLESQIETVTGKGVIVLAQSDPLLIKRHAAAMGEEPAAPSVLCITVYRCSEAEYNPSTRTFGALFKQTTPKAWREAVLELDIDPRFVYTMQICSFDSDGDGVKDNVDAAYTLRVYSTVPVDLEDPGAPAFEPLFEAGTQLAHSKLVAPEGGGMPQAQMVKGTLAGIRAAAPHYLIELEDGTSGWYDADTVEALASNYVNWTAEN